VKGVGEVGRGGGGGEGVWREVRVWGGWGKGRESGRKLRGMPEEKGSVGCRGGVVGCIFL